MSEEIKDVTKEFESFLKVIQFKDIAPGRCSILLAFHLFMGFKTERIWPWKVIDQIKDLENGLSVVRKHPSKISIHH